MDLSRRAFLKSTAAAATPTSALRALADPKSAEQQHPWPENGTLIPDTGWTLWLDREAKWKDDTLYLPEDVIVANLPTNAPTRGWAWVERGCPFPEAAQCTDERASHAADQHEGPIPVTLPGTVEQHFWGANGTRPYTPEEYRYAADDPIPQNGAYFGVSWWYRSIDIPKEWSGKRIFLHIRAAHLRAEVYLNRKLVGYSILEELPFECDLTPAAKPGEENHLAIRITNPFGRYDWVDGLNAQWGAVKLYRSHGFGGLDRGMTLSAHIGLLRVRDAWVLNTTTSDAIKVFLEVEGEANSFQTLDNRLIYELQESQTGKTLARSGIGYILTVERAATKGQTAIYSLTITCPDAQLWQLNHPTLYKLVLGITGKIANDSLERFADTRTIPFAFRTFGPEGVGTNGLFCLNGKRIRLYSAISWGYWGINGMFPTPELAEKEVTQAKKLNLNCLNLKRSLIA